MPGPIKPSEVETRRADRIPEEVLQVINDLITERWNGTSANFTQDEAVRRIVSGLNIARAEVFERGYLDFEEAYRRAGWKVVYDKPGYNETYPATFSFSKRDSL